MVMVMVVVIGIMIADNHLAVVVVVECVVTGVVCVFVGVVFVLQLLGVNVPE